MATAEELLTAEGCGDVLTVDLNSRTIIIPATVTNIGVESDDNVRVLHFKLPRHYCGVDLSEFKININYENAEGLGDIYEATNVVIEDALITFDWVVGRYAVSTKGNVKFSLCLKDSKDGVVNREFNTTIAILPVLQGLETGEAIIEEYVDILVQWRDELFGTGNTVEQSIRNVGEEVKNNIPTAVDEYIAAHKDELKGTSISSIVRSSGTGAAGTRDTYTITMTDGSAVTFQVYNGADGQGAGDMLKSVYDSQNRNTDVFAYIDNKIGDINTLLDTINGEVV